MDCTRQAYLVEKGLFPSKTEAKLIKLLLQENIPIVDLKDDEVTKLLHEYKCVQQQLSPKKFEHFKKAKASI